MFYNKSYFIIICICLIIAKCILAYLTIYKSMINTYMYCFNTINFVYILLHNLAEYTLLFWTVLSTNV